MTTKKMPKPAKILLIVLGILIALLMLLIICVNVFVRSVYGDFYDHAEAEFDQPGLAGGFIPQDLDYLNWCNSWLFSGYMSNGSASPIYKELDDGSFAKLTITLPDGASYDGHGSGITSQGDHVYLTCEEGYLILDAQTIAEAEDGDAIQALTNVPLDFSPAFLNIQDGVLLTGNFYYPEAYETPDHHHIATIDEEENPAVLYAFTLDDSSESGIAPSPDRVYSIPGKVQGACFAPDGRLVLSTSYGLATSHLLSYNLTKAAEAGTFQAMGESVPLFILDSRSLAQDMDVPPMSEGIVCHDGRIFIATESASNKYLFGKLYGGAMIYSVALPE